MSLVKPFLLLAAVITMAACSKDSSKSPSIAEPSKPPEKVASTLDARTVITMFGDSLTAGFGVSDTENYPYYVQQMIDQQGLKFRVVNQGLSGDTTAGGVERVAQVLADKPKIVLLELGGNDGLRGLPVADSKANLEKMIQQLQAGGAKVIFAGITLPRNYGADYIRDFDAMYTTLAEKYQLPFIPFLLQGVALVPGMMQQDGIHATAQGNRVVARTVFQKIAPLLGN